MAANDVLEVMDRLLGNTRTMTGLTGDPAMRSHLLEGEKARAAVAELIELSAKACSVMDGANRSTDRPSSYVSTVVSELRAALARCNGETK